MVDATEEFYPGRADYDHDLDDFDELLKVQLQSCITPQSSKIRLQQDLVLCTHCMARYWLAMCQVAEKAKCSSGGIIFLQFTPLHKGHAMHLGLFRAGSSHKRPIQCFLQQDIHYLCRAIMRNQTAVERAGGRHTPWRQ